MLPLTRNAVYPISQSPHLEPALGSVLISLFLLTPTKVGYVAPARNIFSIFLSLVLYSLSCTSFLSSIPFCSSSNGDCPLHKVLNKVCVTEIVFFNQVLTRLFQTSLCFEITVISDLQKSCINQYNPFIYFHPDPQMLTVYYFCLVLPSLFCLSFCPSLSLSMDFFQNHLRINCGGNASFPLNTSVCIS